MKKSLKKILCALCCLALVLALSGCSLPTTDTDSLLKPPRASGELYHIQKALEASVKEKFTLKFPTSGEWRSAIIERDLDSDGTNEAIAFYSTVTDNVVSMHINLIDQKDGKYYSASDIKCVATGVESVDFRDMDADGNFEVLVGWSVYGALDKQLGVYSFSEGLLKQRLMEKYSSYICLDFTGNGRNDIFVNHLDTISTTATAKLLSFADGGVTEQGVCILDGSVTSHATPIVGKLPNGNTAVYIDAVKGNGMITEILEISADETSGLLHNVLQANGNSISTYRSSAVSVRDNDGDKVYEIPMPELLTISNVADGENVYKTRWYVYDSGDLRLQMSALMNYTDGYYITFPLKWEDAVSVIRDTANRVRTIAAIDKQTGNSLHIILRVQAVPVTAVPSFEGYDKAKAFEVGRNEGYYYVAQLTDYQGPEAVTAEEFKSLFKLF